MDDIRDKFPMPPCVNCGRGMCVKNEAREGYICPSRGQWYELGATIRPMDGMKVASLRPLVLNVRLTTGHWLMAIEHAMETLRHDKMVEAIETQKRWLDEVALPMAEHVREIEQSKQPEPILESLNSHWLDKGWEKKI